MEKYGQNEMTLISSRTIDATSVPIAHHSFSNNDIIMEMTLLVKITEDIHPSIRERIFLSPGKYCFRAKGKLGNKFYTCVYELTSHIKWFIVCIATAI